jgi:hypothetical protein
MRKLITLIFLLSLSVSMMAQRSASTTSVPWNVATKTLVMLPVDSITQHATAYWTFNISRAKTNYFAITVALDTIGAVPCGKTTFDVLGSMDNVNFVATGATQVRPGGTTAGLVRDTTFVLYDVSTGVLYNYLKVQAVSSSSLHIKGVRVSGLSLKVSDK